MFFWLYIDNANQWRWRLYAGNNRIIADSGEGYHNYADCLAMVNAIRAGAATFDVRRQQ